MTRSRFDLDYEGCLNLLAAIVCQARSDAMAHSKPATKFLSMVMAKAKEMPDQPGEAVMAVMLDNRVQYRLW